jgi:hypothetical protein
MIPAVTVPLLSMARRVFPEGRTPEQDSLVGSASLALTDLERQCIDEHYDRDMRYENYVASLPRERAKSVKKKLDDYVCGAISKGNIAGGFAGTAVGFGVGVGIGIVPIPLVMCATVPTCAAIGLFGGIAAGGLAGGAIAKGLGIRKITSSEECVQWIDRRCHEVAIPALMQFMSPEKRARVELDCPITMDRMQDPVEAPDHRVYERSEIVRHLEMKGTSPFTGDRMSIWSLSRKPGYYTDILNRLRQNYNAMVSRRERIIAEWQDRDQDLEMVSSFQVEGVKAEEASQVVRFHSMAVSERREVADEMASAVYSSREIKSHQKSFMANFLTEAATKDPVRI